VVIISVDIKKLNKNYKFPVGILSKLVENSKNMIEEIGST
jgi:hypothetical protein